MDMSRRLAAEFIGTFWLVLGGCGSAVLAAGVPDVGIGYAGVALAFGLTVADRRLCLRPHFRRAFQSGRHIGSFGRRTVSREGRSVPTGSRSSPAASRRAPSSMPSQAARPASTPPNGFASNGYGEHSPQGYSLLAGLICEIVMTFMFLMVILGATSRGRRRVCAARHRARADPDPPDLDSGHQHVGQSGALDGRRHLSGRLGASSQLWVFWVAPLAGGGLAGFAHRWLSPEQRP